MDNLLLVPLIASFSCSIYFYLKYREMHKENDGLLEDLRKIKSTPRSKSMELTEFLGDLENGGFSFVRVDPKSVFYRSPK